MTVAKSKRKKSEKPSDIPASELAPIHEVDVGTIASQSMLRYGIEVNEGRSIPALQDGLKPVNRRILWAAAKTAKSKTKTARLSGEVIGALHPHGDASVNSAITTLVNSPAPVLEGIGNWGTLVDSAAASRYTNVVLSRYGEQFLAKNYLAVTPMTPNYDNREKEPIYLPALLPNILINDNMGIGLGVATRLPSFTPTSLLQVLIRMIDKENITAQDYAKTLKFFEPWGGTPVKSKQNTAAMVKLMEESGTTIEWESPLEVDREAKRMHISKFAPQLNLENFVQACNKLPGVDKVYSGAGLSFTVQVKRSVNFVEFDAIVLKVAKLARTKQKFSIYVSDRVPTTEGKYEVKFHSLSVPDLLLKWLKFRINLEKDSLGYQISQTEKEIRYLELLVHACNHLDIIFAALRKADPAAHISKGLKITPEDAKQILELRVRQLSKLDHDNLKSKLAEVKQKLASLSKKLKRPSQSVRAYFEACLACLDVNDNRQSNCHQWYLKIPRKNVEVDTAQ